ncbi:uncharacterized protein METZ01_LOCUS56063 [marine metagenome]|uniref:Uncharacterized protein n=1 Tax=marine metagenome TaxID=408172 RepID=A0A381SIE7_9ZZZZ
MTKVPLATASSPNPPMGAWLDYYNCD